MSLARNPSALFTSTECTSSKYQQISEYNWDTRQNVWEDVEGVYLVERNDTNRIIPFYTNKWILDYNRNSANGYYPQIEKAMSEIHKYFLGYSLDAEIVVDGNKFASACRQLKDYTTLVDLSNAAFDASIPFTEENGVLKYNGLPIKNIGKLAALTEFFMDSGCSDAYICIYKREDGYYAIKNTNITALSIDSMHKNAFDKTLFTFINELPSSVKDDYLNEKEIMKKQIAETDFSIIENILRDIITSNIYEEKKRDLESEIEYLETPKDLFSGAGIDEDEEGNMEHEPLTKEELMAQLEEIKQKKPEDYGVEPIIKVLRENHTKLQQEYRTKAGSSNSSKNDRLYEFNKIKR